MAVKQPHVCTRNYFVAARSISLPPTPTVASSHNRMWEKFLIPHLQTDDWSGKPSGSSNQELKMICKLVAKQARCREGSLDSHSYQLNSSILPPPERVGTAGCALNETTFSCKSIILSLMRLQPKLSYNCFFIIQGNS